MGVIFRGIEPSERLGSELDHLVHVLMLLLSYLVLFSFV